MINKAILVGNVGKREIKYTKDGKAIGILSVATNESWTDKKTGEKVKRTEWHRVTVFGNLATIVDKYIDIGHQVYIEGKVQTRSYEANGEKKYTTEIVVSDFSHKIMSTSKPSTESNTTQEKPSKPVDPIPAVASDGFEDDMEDIPF